MINYVVCSLETMPKRDYREACHFEGDVREFARRLGTTPIEARNDLGTYLTFPLVADGVAIQLIGLVPFIKASFTVVADPVDRSAARAVVKELLQQIGYDAPEYKDKFLPDITE